MRSVLGVRWFMALSLAVALSTAVLGCFDSSAPGDDAARRDAPDFELVRLDGVPVSLAEHRGKTVILDFWATWCAPCEVQMPVLQTLWENRGGEDLVVLGLSLDTDPADDVIEWLSKREISYPIAIAEQQLAIDYGAWAYPTLVVVDPAGAIYKVHQGVLSRPELEDVLDEIQRKFAAKAKTPKA
jgi:peroxiredoxin